MKAAKALLAAEDCSSFSISVDTADTWPSEAAKLANSNCEKADRRAEARDAARRERRGLKEELRVDRELRDLRRRCMLLFLQNVFLHDCNDILSVREHPETPRINRMCHI